MQFTTQEILVALIPLAFHIPAIIFLLFSERRQPSATLAWLLTLIFLPVIGLVLYLLIGRTRSRHIANRVKFSVAQVETVLRKHSPFESAHECNLRCVEPRTATMAQLGKELASTPALDGNRVQLLIDAEHTYTRIVGAIEQAREHIHVQFYIIQPDETGRGLRDRLTRRAHEGIQVRVLVDGLGSASLPGDFWKPLTDAGGQAAIFRPIWGILSRILKRDRIDYRNHRKIVVVDGKSGFTGGINVGREYLGLDPEIGRWRDTHVMLEGPSVLALQKTFAEDWLLTTGELLEDASYFPECDVRPAENCIVQVLDSGPDRRWSPIAFYQNHIFALAANRVWITSPYFIPSPSLEDALISASLRGVDVRLLVPMRSDSRLVAWASASYYPRLIEAGVRIYRYERGFVHAKTMVVDNWVASVGSANMDLRSFHLNFELNVFVYGAKFVNDLATQFEIDLEHATELREAPSGWRILRGNLARILSPLL